MSVSDGEPVTSGVWVDEVPAVSGGALALRADVGPTRGTPDFEDGIARPRSVARLPIAGDVDILPALKREDSTVGVRLRRFPGGNLRVCMLLVGTVSAW